MANLRADNLTGTGGRNALDGSVFFDGESRLELDGSSDFAFGTGDFTIEMWIKINDDTNTNTLYDSRPAGSNGAQVALFYSGSSNGILFAHGGTVRITGTVDVGADQAWHHIALTRASGSTKLFVDGVQDGSTYSSDTTDYLNPSNKPRIGASGGSTDLSSDGYFRGYISNVRVNKGSALYTAAFTPPTEKLTAVDGTSLLCCQDSDDPTQEATGKTITGYGNLAAGQPIAPKVLPPVGVDEGVVFDGDTKVNSQGYMYFPTGDTSQRSRGRCIISNGSPGSQSLYYLQMQSGGIVQNFGLLANNVQLSRACGSSTRMLVADGYISPATTNVIEYITIATTGGGTDYGDLTVARRRALGMANTTRGVWVGGTGASPAASYYNEQDYNTIASAGNATDFGDASTLTSTGNGVSSSTRGVYSIAHNGSTSAYNNTLEYITFATTGSRTNFGDLSAAKGYHMCGCSSSDSTRGLFAGGYNPVQDTIDYITIASTGDATDFGNLSVARRSGMATGNSIDAIFVGGYLPGVSNTIDKVTIQTTGDAVDFGDLTVKFHEGACSSDSHGGLS